MSYQKKSWSDRQSEYPNRRLLTPVAGQEHIFEVYREEGLVEDEGSAFDQQNMNDLETRVENAFGQVADGSLKAGTAAVADSANAVAWGNVGGKPATFPSAGHTHTTAYTATIATTWAGGSLGPWTQSVAVQGITAADTPMVDIVLSGDAKADCALLENWSMVSRITTQAGGIMVTCYDDAPTVAMPIQMKAVR